jgi:hypothetical protein
MKQSFLKPSFSLYNLGNKSFQAAPIEVLLYSLNSFPLVCIELVYHHIAYKILLCKYLK